MIENNRTLPYGEAWLSDVASANDKKFTTYDRDKESGLDYAMARMYANNIGRFNSPDQGPIRPWAPTSLNRYTYGNLDPVNNIDPSGNDTCEQRGLSNCVDVTEPPPPELELFRSDLKGSPNPCPPDYRGAECGGGTDLGGGGGGATPPRPSPTQANCQSGLKTAQKTGDGIARAMADRSILMAAVAGTSIPWELLAAIGIRETNYENIDQIGGGGGRGKFQIDIDKNPGVAEGDARNTAWAANWAAKKLARDYAFLAKHHPNFTSSQLLQATAAAYNMGLGRNPVGKNFSGNPGAIDVGTTDSRGKKFPGNYGSNVMNLMDCFK